MQKAIISVLMMIVLIAIILSLSGNLPSQISTHTTASIPSDEKNIPFGEVHEISIYKNLISDPELTINQGDVVIWINDNLAPHTITADNNEFSSEKLMQGDLFDHRFMNKGTYTYYSKFNSNIKGTITVE